jgi:hypothetical protein
MSRWFRVYSELVDDPKFIRLGPDLRSALLMMWCVAAANDGKLPPLPDMAVKFRLSEARTKKLLDELRRCGFVDDDETGSSPHNWSGRQYKSDVSNERVKRYRQRKCNVTVTPPDTDTDTEQKKDAAPTGAQVVPLPQNPEKIFFDQAVQFLGPDARSLAAKLLKAKGGNVLAAHQALLTAAQKSNPREYLGAIIRGRDSVEDLRARGEAW